MRLSVKFGLHPAHNLFVQHGVFVRPVEFKWLYYDLLQRGTLACAAGIFAFKLLATRVAAAEPKSHEPAVNGLQ